MSRRVKIVLSVLVAVVLLTVGSAVTVMAQGEPPPAPEAGAKGLPARVVAILGISQEEMVNALKQAQQERLEEVFDKLLDKAAEKGSFTPEEVRAIKQWWQQRPETQDKSLIKEWWEQRPELSHPGLLVRILKVSRQGQLPGEPGVPQPGLLIARAADILGIPKEDVIAAFKQAQQEMRTEGFDKMLDKAVEKELITDEEAGEIRAWWESRPEALGRLTPGVPILQAIRGRQ